MMRAVLPVHLRALPSTAFCSVSVLALPCFSVSLSRPRMRWPPAAQDAFIATGDRRSIVDLHVLSDGQSPRLVHSITSPGGGGEWRREMHFYPQDDSAWFSARRAKESGGRDHGEGASTRAAATLLGGSGGGSIRPPRGVLAADL